MNKNKKINIFLSFFVGTTIASIIIPFFSHIQNYSTQNVLTNDKKNNSYLRATVDPNRKDTYIDVEKMQSDMQTKLDLNQFVYNVSQDQIKKFILSYIVNPPPSFTWRNIQFVGSVSDPNSGWKVQGVLGNIDATISLNRFLDSQGVQQNFGFEPIKFTFGQFYPAPGDTIVTTNSFATQNANIIPSDVFLDNDIFLKLIKENNIVANIPQGCDVYLENFKFSNTEGKVFCDISVNGYFKADENNNYIFYNENKKLVENFAFTGFKKLQETTTRQNIPLPDVSDQLASKYAVNDSQIKQLIIDNSNPLPNGFNSDDIIINQSIPNNVDGTITVVYSMRNFYNESVINGSANPESVDVNLISNFTQRDNIIISGFLRTIPTNIPEQIPIPNATNTLAQSVTDTQIKQIILKSIENINNIGINEDNIVITKKQVDNLSGVIRFVPKLDKFVDKNGVVYNVKGEFRDLPTVVISGFKNISPTRIIPNSPFVGDPDLIPSDAISHIDILKNIIVKNIENLPDGFSNDNVIINNYTYNNKVGTITLSFTLNLYYDAIGFLISTPTFPVQYISIRGFKTSEPTVIKKSYDIPDVSEVNAIDYTDEELTNFIKTNIRDIAIPLPSDFDPENNLVINQINRYNAKGYIEAFVQIDNFFDSNGSVVNNGSDTIYSKVRFSGFHAVLPTTIKNECYLDNAGDISAADVNEQQLINMLINFTNPNSPKSPLIDNLPVGGVFTNKNISINIVDAISSGDSTYIIANISLDTYYNSEGILIENSSQKIVATNVKIYGFKNVRPTEITNSFRVPSSSEYSNIYASDVKTWNKDTTNNISIENLIETNLSSFLNSYPSNVYIKDIVVKNVINTTGTIVIDLYILNYYNSIGKTESTIALSQTVTISGFKIVNPTSTVESYAVSDVGNILATSFTSNNLHDVIWENKNFIFENLPSNFGENDFSVSLSPSSANNLDGSINATIEINNYFDAFGSQQTLIPLFKNVIFIGFKIIEPTFITSDVSITKPNITKVLPSEFSDVDLLNYLFDDKDSIFTNLPDDFSISDIVLDRNSIIRNNLTGQIIIDKLSISKFYDQNGNVVDNNGTLLSEKITISGFGSINVSTNIVNSVDLSGTDFSYFLPSEITVDMLKEIIISKSLVNYPTPTFSILDIVMSDGDIITTNNLDGTMLVDVKIKNYYNSEGFIVDSVDNLLSTNLTINGLKKSKPTLGNDVTLKNINNEIPSKILSNQLLNIVRNNWQEIFPINTVPNDFSSVNIISSTTKEYDNIEGTITAEITLNYFYDPSGAVVSNGNTKTVDVVISGFKSIKPTELLTDTINTNFSSDLASNQTNGQISQIIQNNKYVLFDSLPPDFIESNIEIKNISFNNILGEITVDLSLNYYISDNGVFINTLLNPNLPEANYKIKIIGYKKVSKTAIKDSFTVSGKISTKIPSSVSNEEILQLISNDPTNFIDNPYIDQSSFLNDVIITNVKANNLNGTITFNLSLTKYYNEEGILITNGLPLSKEFKLVGFSTINQTIFNKSVDLNQSDTLEIPQLINSEKLTEIIFDNKNLFFENFPVNFVKDNIVVQSIDTYNNLEGSLSATLKVDNYVDQNGFLQTNNPYRYIVNIEGFASIKATKIKDDALISNFSNISNNIPSHFFNNLNLLQNLIVQNRRTIFENVPPYFDDAETFKSFLQVKPISYNNAEGYIIVNVSLNQYYDSNGNLILNKNPLSKNVKLYGFTQSLPTELTTTIVDLQDPNKYNLPTQVSIEEVQYIIKQQYPDFLKYLPPNFSPENIVNIVKLGSNDVNGTIQVKFSLNLFYNSKGELISNAELFTSEITIRGFKSKPSSKFLNSNGQKLSIGSFTQSSIDTNFSNVLPSEIYDYYTNVKDGSNIESQKEKIDSWLYSIVKEKIENVSDTSKKNIVVKFKEDELSNKEGFITVSVKIITYVSASIGTESTAPANFIVRLNGFKKKETSTEIKDNTLVIVVSILAAAAVIAIIALLLFVFRFRIWRRSIA